MDDDRPTVLELFAGIGGLSLGLERAGFHVVGQVEIDPFARSILTKHWPEVPKHDDVKTALAWWLSEPRPRVDCVAGGYPCQPESLAGARRGTDDERWLWPEFANIVHALRPRWVIGENVIGHRTKGLRFVLADLEQLGYTARAGTLSAGEMGAPHKRNRIFVLAESADAEREQLRQQPGRCGGPDGEGTAEPGHDGTAQPVANAERHAGFPRRAGDAEQGQVGRNADRGGVVGDVADAHGDARRSEARDAVAGTGATAAGLGATQRGSSAGRDWWAAEPDVGRVAHGVPARVDRLRGLGNAVVPYCGEFIGNLVRSGAWRDAR